MAIFDYQKREIHLKVVYYGPGLSGKTTNIQYIFDHTRPDNKGKLISLATQTDRTLFFDFLPLELGTLGGYKLRFHIYTVPGQVHYDATRKLVLKGVDGIVFVADSQREMKEANIQSLVNMEKNLLSYNKKVKDLPTVFQANKRDLANIMSLEEMGQVLNRYQFPLVEASAAKGSGVLETLRLITKLVIRSMKDRVQSEAEKEPLPSFSPPPAAPEPVDEPAPEPMPKPASPFPPDPGAASPPPPEAAPSSPAPDPAEVPMPPPPSPSAAEGLDADRFTIPASEGGAGEVASAFIEEEVAPLAGEQAVPFRLEIPEVGTIELSLRLTVTVEGGRFVRAVAAPAPVPASVPGELPVPVSAPARAGEGRGADLLEPLAALGEESLGALPSAASPEAPEPEPPPLEPLQLEPFRAADVLEKESHHPLEDLPSAGKSGALRPPPDLGFAPHGVGRNAMPPLGREPGREGPSDDTGETPREEFNPASGELEFSDHSSEGQGGRAPRDPNRGGLFGMFKKKS